MSGLPTVSLPRTGITTSVLGFGCSQLLGPKSRYEALRLLETAYESGIRHFDVARAYGSGDAEGVLGGFVGGRRDEVTITTKFGIQPLPAVANRRVLLGAARRLMKASPTVRRFLGRQGARMVRRGAFSVEEARQSLETSLREMRTDYVDIFLLHDCAPEDCSPDLLDFLNSAVATGKVRTFGVGTSPENAAAIPRLAAEFASVLQFEHGALRPTVDEVDPAADRAVITHGALAGLGRLRRYLADNPDVRTRWSNDVDADCGQDPILAALLIQYAVETNGRGPVLFSSTRVDNVVGNVAAVVDQNLSSRIDRFAALVADACGRDAWRLVDEPARSNLS
jgi:D-threo-aldose 1-dehydrogenase